MTISKHISDFVKFTILILLAIGGAWFVPLNSLPFGLGNVMLCSIVVALLIGFCGMIVSLIAWFVAGAVARRRTKKLPPKDLSHE